MAQLCEARIPTYRRPALLQRALDSLRAQTYPQWRAIVFDDSPNREGEPVVRALSDERIEYRPNKNRLGAAANIDRVFAPTPYAQGDFAFVLEDDAALHPDYLSENLRLLESADASLLMRNQAIFEDGADGWADTGETTRGGWLEAGRRSAFEIYALLFFMEGVSNGGLFWRLWRDIDLRVGETVTDAGLQECCRTLLIRQPVLFAPEPLAIFTRLPADKIERSVADNRTFARGSQSLRTYLWKTYGESVISAATAIARRTGKQAVLDQVLLEIGYQRADAKRLSGIQALKLTAKGTARRLLVTDPVADFLSTLSRSAS